MTPRQSEALDLRRQGISFSEIGARLEISKQRDLAKIRCLIQARLAGAAGRRDG